MSITISVSPRIEEKLRQWAIASGRELAQYASELVEKAVSQEDHGYDAPMAVDDNAKRQVAWNDFVTAMCEHAMTLPAGHVIDDSRESIYAGRGPLCKAGCRGGGR